MGNQGWLHRSCGLRARRKRSRGQAERADGKPECGELYRGGPRLSGPIHRRFSLFAQKNSEVGAATPTSKRAIPALPPLFTLIGGRAWAHRPGSWAPERPATAPGRASFITYIAIVGAATALRCASLLSAQVCTGLHRSAQVCMGRPVTYWDSWGRSRLAAASRRCSGSDP